MSFAIIYKNIEYEISDKDKEVTTKLIENFNGTNNELEDLLEASNINYIMDISFY